MISAPFSLQPPSHSTPPATFLSFSEEKLRSSGGEEEEDRFFDCRNQWDGQILLLTIDDALGGGRCCDWLMRQRAQQMKLLALLTELVEAFDQETAAVVMARLTSLKMEMEGLNYDDFAVQLEL